MRGAAKPGLQADGGFIAPSLTLVTLGSLNRGKLYFPLRIFCVGSEYVRRLGTALSRGAVQELLWGFGAPITLSTSPGEALVLCRKMSSVDSDGKGVTEMAVILAP